jgi:hypothetical protein
MKKGERIREKGKKKGKIKKNRKEKKATIGVKKGLVARGGKISFLEGGGG